MFIGHFGVGFGVKRAQPKASLGTLFIAAQFLDLLWPLFLLLGWERVEINPPGTSSVPLNFVSYPWTHSLLMAIVWGLVVGGIYFLLRRDVKGFIILALAVVSHWVLDLFVHHPDLPIVPGGATFLGWKLWDYRAIELVIEFAIFAAGIILYQRATTAKDRIGSYGLWVLVLLLVLSFVSSLVGPPPPNSETIA